jgi:amino-acid N-acetyltransferase
MQSELILLMANGFVAEVLEQGKPKIVGFAAVEIYSRKLGEIQCLAVDNGYQGRGIGSDLVKACVERAREKGILEVMAISASDEFLRKLGFDYSLPEQKRALFFQLHSRDDIFRDTLENDEDD